MAWVVYGSICRRWVEMVVVIAVHCCCRYRVEVVVVCCCYYQGGGLGPLRLGVVVEAVMGDEMEH